jgi:hypothetical protein
VFRREGLCRAVIAFLATARKRTADHLATSSEQHVCSRFTHQIETAQSLAKHGVTDIAASIQHDGACLFISGIRFQWQFKDEACGVPARHSSRNHFAPLQGACGTSPLRAMRSKPPGKNARARRAFRSRPGLSRPRLSY